MAKFNMNDTFTADSFDDVMDLVIDTDGCIDSAIEKCEEKSDNDLSSDGDIDVIDALKEDGIIAYDCDDEPDEDTKVLFDDTDMDYDDADFVSADAQDFRESRDNITDAEDDDDDLIDTVIGDDNDSDIDDAYLDDDY